MNESKKCDKNRQLLPILKLPTEKPINSDTKQVKFVSSSLPSLALNSEPSNKFNNKIEKLDNNFHNLRLKMRAKSFYEDEKKDFIRLYSNWNGE
jgi:hypothetical protein